jgi:hypothetical protein
MLQLNASTLKVKYGECSPNLSKILRIKKETPMQAVPSMRIEWKVDAWVVKVALHQLVVGDFMVLVKVALLLHPLNPSR